ncbi:hypothetical protein [Chamaesiphon sp. VAR_69_metabat_338]|uniref:hypothetical protein n=1 Tax=Chamaesiphon sp. VAR_69_metabat_338 TaxID=2964704 RepID=UPI00286E61CD|nr:hypothetical protein [Chamaesiphon sp. VAR_69_metabat_338]
MIINLLVKMSWCGLLCAWLYPYQSLAQAPTKTVKNNPTTYEDDRIKIVVRECTHRLQDLICKATLTSKNSDRTIDINGNNIKLVDFEGNEYYPTSLQLANRSSENNTIRTELIENVPVKATFVFAKVPTNLSQIALLQIPLSGGVNTTTKFRNFGAMAIENVASKPTKQSTATGENVALKPTKQSTPTGENVVAKPAKPPTAIGEVATVLGEVSGDNSLVCPDGTKILYRATSKSYLMFICGTKMPTHYVGLSKDGSQGITLRLRYYDRTQFSADNGETNYTIAANRLIIRKDSKIIYQEKIQVLQALPNTIATEEPKPKTKPKKNPTPERDNSVPKRSAIVQPTAKAKQ